MRKVLSVLVALSMSSVSFAQSSSSALAQRDNEEAQVTAERIATLRDKLATLQEIVAQDRKDLNRAMGMGAVAIAVPLTIGYLTSSAFSNSTEPNYKRLYKKYFGRPDVVETVPGAPVPGSPGSIDEALSADLAKVTELVNKAQGFADSAATSASNASTSELAAKTAADAAQASATAAGTSAGAASTSAANANTSELAAAASAEAAAKSATAAKAAATRAGKTTTIVDSVDDSVEAVAEKTKNVFARGFGTTRDFVKGRIQGVKNIGKGLPEGALRNRLIYATTGLVVGGVAYYAGERIAEINTEINLMEAKLAQTQADLVYLQNMVRLTERP